MNNDYKQIFGVKFHIEPIGIKGLPIYVTARRSFYKLSYKDNSFILVKPAGDEKFGVVALEKQAALISAHTESPVAFRFEELTRSQRDSLLDRNIPFISDSGQLYLPFLGLMLSDRFVKKKADRKLLRFMPITQVLLLYLIYKSGGKPIMKKDAAENLGVTKMSITRASEQLASLELISQDIRGKECYMTINGTGLQVYEKAKTFMINPVQKIITVSDISPFAQLCLSGESALSKCTMLSAPDIPEYAIDKTEVDVAKIPTIDERWDTRGEAVKLQLWKYDPKLFAQNGVVDPISLAQCYDEYADERIETAIEEYLEEYKW